MSEKKQPEPMQATPMMAAAGLSFDSLMTYARKTIELLQTTGDEFLDLAEQGFRMWNAISTRDLSGILAAFAAGQRDVQAIIAAIKKEFDITD